MNRRNFLALLAAAFTQDPERLLWRPGAKLISIPKGSVIQVNFTGESTPMLDEINAVTMKYLAPQIVDIFYRNSPVYTRLTSRGLTYADF